MKLKKYKYNIGEIINNLKILDQCNIKNGKGFRKGYKYQCIKDKYIGYISESNLLNNKGCPVCSGRISLKGYNDIHTVARWMEDWTINPIEISNLLPHSSKKIKCKCPVCNSVIGYRRVSEIYNHNVVCPNCSDGISYPEKFMYNLLKQLGIDFEYQYSPDWIKPKRYDFYFEFNNKKYIIEMDGGIGHGNKNRLSNMTSEESKAIDNIKDQIAIKHEIELFRIDCKKSELNYIKNNILNSSLSKLFNLSNINWFEIDKQSQKSFIKKICNYKNNNPSVTTSQIATIYNLSSITISKYLKIGNKYGWCIYNPKNEMSKNGAVNGKANSKKVICLNTGKIYDSAKQAAIDTQVCRKSICSCCNGKYQSAGKLPDGTKLYWKYI